MSNLEDVKPEKIFVNLNGKDLELIYDLNAFAELEEVYGTVDQAMEAMEKGSVKAIRVMLWAGLVHNFLVLNDKGMVVKYDITPHTVGAWLNPASLEDISQQLGRALVASLPKSKLKELPEDFKEQLETVMAQVVLTEDEKKEEEEKKL